MGRSKLLAYFLTLAISKIKKLDPDVFTPLNAHIGKIIEFRVDTLLSKSKRVYLIIEKNNIAVSDAAFSEPDLILIGKMGDLGRLALDLFQSEQESAIEWASLLPKHHIQCHGDTRLLQACQHTVKHLDVDWSALWALAVGPQLAFPLSQFFKKNKDVFKDTSQSTKEAIKEYVLYEKQYLVPGLEIEEWIEDITMLKNDTDRLEKNVQFLKHRIEKL